MVTTGAEPYRNIRRRTEKVIILLPDTYSFADAPRCAYAPENVSACWCRKEKGVADDDAKIPSLFWRGNKLDETIRFLRLYSLVYLHKFSQSHQVFCLLPYY